jgi:hypothetical protein
VAFASTPTWLLLELLPLADATAVPPAAPTPPPWPPLAVLITVTVPALVEPVALAFAEPPAPPMPIGPWLPPPAPPRPPLPPPAVAYVVTAPAAPV